MLIRKRRGADSKKGKGGGAVRRGLKGGILSFARGEDMRLDHLLEDSSLTEGVYQGGKDKREGKKITEPVDAFPTYLSSKKRNSPSPRGSTSISEGREKEVSSRSEMEKKRPLI